MECYASDQMGARWAADRMVRSDRGVGHIPELHTTLHG